MELKAIKILKAIAIRSKQFDLYEEAIAELKLIQDIILEKDEALEIERLLFKNKLEALIEKDKTVCNNCIYANKNMIKDKIVCDIFVSTNRKGTVEKDFGCNKGKTKC